MTRKISSSLMAFVLPALVILPSAASAADAVSFEAGTGNKTRLLRLGVQWQWKKKWFENERFHVSGYWDLSLANWEGRRYRNQEDENQNINAIGIVPVFRFQRNVGYGPYMEAGVGPHLLSELYDNNNKQLSTRFQFGSLVGIGYATKNNWDVGLRLQHYSNASIKKPNDGVNFIIARISYRF